jgi:flagellar L-ring protein FlgH
MKKIVAFASIVLASTTLPAWGGGSLYQEASFRPLTSDHRALRVGDSLTVLVFENSSASTSAGTDTERNVDIGLGVTVTRPTREATGSLVFNNDFSGAGKLQRSGKLAAQITVTVQSVDPNGDLHVAGRQLIAVNEDKQEIVLAGRVRPQDISENNTVVSSRLADATISYVGEGLLAEKQKPGLATRLLGWLGLI